jgi:hypothetical protein
LLKFKTTKQKDYHSNLATATPPKIFPTSMITAESHADETANILFAPVSSDPYCLVVDRFAFMIYETEHDIKQNLKPFSNTKINDCRIMIFSQQAWQTTIVEGAMDVLAKKALQQKPPK